MFYWLIPYLVSYNASDTGNWNYGPEHLFKVEASSAMIYDDVTTYRFDTNVSISCRPIILSSIQCHIESSKHDVYETDLSSGRHSGKFEQHKKFPGIDNVTFQVEFNKMGPHNVTFLNSKDYFPRIVILAIISELNIGTDLSIERSSKEISHEERTVNGMCETRFDVRKEKSYEKNEQAAIEGFNFEVTSFPERDDNESIIIEKKRQMNNCSIKRNFLFNPDTEKDNTHKKWAYNVENLMTRSTSIIRLGKNGFSSYCENEGSFVVKTVGSGAKFYHESKPKTGKLSEVIRVKLVAIRPATEKV